MWLFTTIKGLLITAVAVAYFVAVIYLATWAFNGFWDVVTFIIGALIATLVFAGWYNYTFNIAGWLKSK